MYMLNNVLVLRTAAINLQKDHYFLNKNKLFYLLYNFLKNDLYIYFLNKDNIRMFC
jgi:hypothetical protein